MFKIDEKTGKLTKIGDIPVMGKTPRNFIIEPSGSFLLVGNQDTNNIVAFDIDQGTGLLTQVSQIEAPTPVCILPTI